MAIRVPSLPARRDPLLVIAFLTMLLDKVSLVQALLVPIVTQRWPRRDRIRQPGSPYRVPCAPRLPWLIISAANSRATRDIPSLRDPTSWLSRRSTTILASTSARWPFCSGGALLVGTVRLIRIKLHSTRQSIS